MVEETIDKLSTCKILNRYMCACVEMKIHTEISEFPLGEVKKLGIFLSPIFSLVKLQYQRPPCHNPCNYPKENFLSYHTLIQEKMQRIMQTELQENNTITSTFLPT